MQRHVQPDVVLDFDAARELRVEADTLEAQHGPNPYSDFLRKHGRLPDPKTAATIGRILGGRVQANDGSLQPPETANDRAAAKQKRAQQRAYAKRCEQVARLRAAIATLASLEASSDSILLFGEIAVGDPAMVAKVDDALRCLHRFAGQCHGQSQKPSAQKQGARN
ncbi:MAG TPA: hypothetical protein VG819_13840 [Rhizomicrobium sp.]|nr:hypothetical protein [Rhizomicrobium sp.]